MVSDAFTQAQINRSKKTIKTELEFLADSQVITQEQLHHILDQLRDETEVRSAAPVASAVAAAAPAQLPPTNGFSSMSLNEKQHPYYETPAATPNPPPAYPTPSATPAPLCHAAALYQYNPTDAGDLALMPNDQIAVTEYMNAEWWKGRNQRTNQEGIFPRSYVRTIEEKGAMAPAAPAPSNYGNMPLDVSQSGSAPSEPGKQGKGAEMGKKIGKKMGNAAIFGAGATIGSNIVNGIF